jgi:NEDD8-activating enzyme E1 regulatory subunit
MKAKSSVYVQLQNIYKAKAHSDVAEVFSMVQALPGGGGIDHGDVELFCKNAAFVKLINGSTTVRGRINEAAGKHPPLFWEHDEMTWHELTTRARAVAELGCDTSLLPIFLALSATSHAMPASESDLLAAVDGMVPGASSSERVQSAVREVFRAGGGELHNVSAATGGMVAQEMIKIITKQYIPIDNTCIFDGISSRCQELRL